MSVEEQPVADIATTDLEISKQPNMGSVNDSAETVLLEESERSNSKQNSISIENDKEENGSVPTIADCAESPSDFQEWFAALNAEDRSAATSFLDVAFLGVFWEYAAPSWSSSSSSHQEDAPQLGTDVASLLDWNTMVSVKEFLARYEACEEGSNLETESSKGKETEEEKTNENEVDKPIATTKIESTALRIGNVSEFLNAAVVIFPAAAHYATNQQMEGPIVTLQPSVWVDYQEQDWGIAINIPGMESVATKSEWILRMCDGNVEQHLPLSSFFIARFQRAISESYLDWERRRHATADDAISLVTREVFSHCQGVKDIMMIMDSSSSCSFLEPLVDVCFGSKHNLSNLGSMSFDNAILTPLHWLVHYHVRRNNRLFGWTEMDHAVKASLQRMADHGSNEALEGTGDIVNSCEGSALDDGFQPNDIVKMNEDGASGPSKKKKKKTKKRKGKKNLSLGSPSSISRKMIPSNEKSEKEKNVGLHETNQTPDEPKNKSEMKNTIRPSELSTSTKDESKNFENCEKLLEDAIESAEGVASSSSLIQEAISAESTASINRTRLDSHSTEESEDTDFSGFVPTFAGKDVKKPPVSFAGHLGQVNGPSAKDEKENSATETSGSSSKVDTQTNTAVVHRSQSDDGDSWETVEVRGKASRKKERAHHGRHSHNSAATVVSHDSHGKRPKGQRTPVPRRKNLGNRKMVREILFSVIDAVEEHSRKKKQTPVVPMQTPLSPSKPSGNSWQNGPPGAKPSSLLPARKDFASVVAGGTAPKKENAIRLTAAAQTKKASTTSTPTDSQPLPRVDETVSRNRTAQSGKVTDPPSPRKHSPIKGKGVADQNTAPTYQETVSASSAFRNFSQANIAEKQERASKDSSASADTDEAPQKRDRQGLLKNETNGTPSPPLPTTLLAPENSNSATSSVASSLDAPYAGRLHHHHHHHHTATVSDINDVGYHLLDVCDRLSRDMNLFMSRRALALNTRRMERGALLAALQDNVSSIWPGRCHVELYGSCATLLDLPASDLDVVVRGLDRNIDMIPRLSHSGSSSSMCANIPIDEPSLVEETQQQKPQQAQLQMHHHIAAPYMWHHVNAERVVRLASNLEKQPWAVRVNAIPTASVPVVKILADPSKLIGAPSGSERVTQQHLAVAASGVGRIHDSTSEPQQNLLQWRGSDVMNGLLSLDITFEGPEHGGIGSTEFSAMVVAEACAESGLQPDSTPFVQVLMVLKELLAQRKLNEPYSGGLSSYALMLLVLALVREREAIKEEIDRVERQKRAMAEAEKKHSMPRDSNLSASQRKSLSCSSSDAKPESVSNNGSSDGGKEGSSSWANIAKKKTITKSSEKQQVNKVHSSTGLGTKEDTKAVPARKPSFADAVSRKTPKEQTSSKASGADETKKSAPEMDSRNRTDESSQRNEKGSSNHGNSKVISSGHETAKSSTSKYNRASSATLGSSCVAPEHYPQGFNDIVEVLCSGETTAGKLLMHFLLYYGQHFDAQTTAIDISGKHERDPMGQFSPYYISPYILRKAPGTIDPVTGMLTVDPIVIYDPLEGAENNNVARRCFAWNSVRWIFAQSYATLASAVERSATPPSTPGGKPITGATGTDHCGRTFKAEQYNPNAMGDLMDPSSPLLRCLLSF